MLRGRHLVNQVAYKPGRIQLSHNSLRAAAMSFAMHDISSCYQMEAALMPEVVLPGFRFHPTDEELVGFYLHRKVEHRPLPFEVITQLDIYKHDPWDLPRMAVPGDDVWYFFCLRDQKYRNSTRPNRVAKGGFWKATGPDRAIYTSDGSKCIGLKKSLVFYKGKAAKGTKTDWVMHEFRLPVFATVKELKKRDCKLAFEESWAVCRIFKKRPMVRKGVSSSSWTDLPADEVICSQDGQNVVQQSSSFDFPVANSTLNSGLSPLDTSFLSSLTSEEEESTPSSTLRSSPSWDLAALLELTAPQ